MSDFWEFIGAVFGIAIISCFCTPSDNSMKVDFYDKMEQIMIEAAEVDNSFAGYFVGGLFGSQDGRTLLRAGIKENYDVEINDWWVVKTLSIRDKDSGEEFEVVGWGLFWLTFFSDDKLEEEFN